MPDKSDLNQESITVLNLASPTLEHVQGSGINTVGQLCEFAACRLHCPGSFDKMMLQEICQRLAEHGLPLTNDGQSKSGTDDARIALVMIILTLFFHQIDPCPMILVIVCIALGIGFGARALRLDRGPGRFMGGLAVVILTGMALLLIVERWGKGWL